MRSKAWVDAPRYTFAEVKELTGLGAPHLHALRLRQQWRPQHKPRHGGPAVRRTYTPRDVLRVMVIAPALGTNTQLPAGDRNGSSPALLAALLRALDRQIDEAVADRGAERAEFVVPRLGAASWCVVKFDLGLLVATQLKRLMPQGSANSESMDLRGARGEFVPPA
jgi:hypothetical protein